MLEERLFKAPPSTNYQQAKDQLTEAISLRNQIKNDIEFANIYLEEKMIEPDPVINKKFVFAHELREAREKAIQKLEKSCEAINAFTDKSEMARDKAELFSNECRGLAEQKKAEQLVIDAKANCDQVKAVHQELKQTLETKLQLIIHYISTRALSHTVHAKTIESSLVKINKMIPNIKSPPERKVYKLEVRIG